MMVFPLLQNRITLSGFLSTRMGGTPAGMVVLVIITVLAVGFFSSNVFIPNVTDDVICFDDSVKPKDSFEDMAGT